MKPIGILAWQELKVLLADKQALAILFLMPAALIVFLSLALNDIYDQKVGKKLNVKILTQKESIADDIVDELKKHNYRVAVDEQEQVLTPYFGKDEFEAVVLIPKSLEKAVLQGEDKKIKVHFRPTLDASYKELIKSHLTMALQSVVIHQVNLSLDEMRKQEPQGAAQSIGQITSSKKLFQEEGPKLVIPNPVQQSIPGWSLFAMFFIVIPISNSFIRDRQLGVLTRLMTYGLSKKQLFVGKLLPFLAVNILQFFLMLLLGLTVVPLLIGKALNIHGLGLSLIVVTVVCSIAATSYGLLVATLSKTLEQASSFGPMSIVILALLGGVMIPHFVMPHFMQKLSMVSPLYWGLQSYLDLFLLNRSLHEIAPGLVVLLTFAMIVFALSVRYFRWSEQ